MPLNTTGAQLGIFLITGYNHHLATRRTFLTRAQAEMRVPESPVFRNNIYSIASGVKALVAYLFYFFHNLLNRGLGRAHGLFAFHSLALPITSGFVVAQPYLSKGQPLESPI